MLKELQKGVGGMALLAAVTLVFFAIADLIERLHAADHTFGWWAARQIHRIF
jgi:hypothetical protein